VRLAGLDCGLKPKNKEKGMTIRHLVRLAAVGALLSFAGQLLAQSTTMETRQGSRHAGPGAVNASASTFAVGITLNNGASFVNTATVSQSVGIRGEIRPEPANVGQTASIFVVDRLLGGGFMMRNQSGTWVSWNASVSSLVPFKVNEPLDAVESIAMFTGTLGTVGDHRIFLGYLPPDGILRYHTSGLPLSITAASTQTPMEQATALFSSKINPNIVQNSCISCHIDGGLAGHLHTFVVGSSTSALNTNFNVFRGLMGRGKPFLMNYVASTNTSHQGGQAVQGAQNIADFDQFLTLLQQL
jgi:hypothetical protein